MLNPEQNKAFDKASKKAVVGAMIDAMNKYFGPDTAKLVQKTFKLVSKMDEDKIRERSRNCLKKSWKNYWAIRPSGSSQITLPKS